MSTAIVSGGSSGIGAAICKRFLDEAWQVVSLSRRKPALSDVRHVEIDLAETLWPPDLLENIVTSQDDGQFALIHNAAEFRHDHAFRVDEAYLQRAFNLMVLAPARLNQLIAPCMGRGSAILYIGSTLSEIAVPQAFSYVALKHATVGMMRATQQDFSGGHVHSCCICPGVTATPMVLANTAINDSFLRDRVSFGRLVAPEEIAALVHFCAVSPALNGAVLHANLGQINR